MRQYYDSLFQDLEGSNMYADFVKKHGQGSTLLEFACGTGDLLVKLSDQFDCVGLDLDKTMIDKAIAKYPQFASKFTVGNFLTYRDTKHYDTLICVGDSLNYLHDEDELNQFVESATFFSNCIILDMHHPYRLEEFEDGYYEEGDTSEFQYMYVIDSEDDHLIHTINFMDGTFDQVLQWVFDPAILIEAFQAKGFTVEIYTDFETKGIESIGEKVMLVCKK
ncbi:SAM-dependent methyltransferase [Erysipelothrix larvae]|uniref:SAM-dependent methyltransferase n=1 Tax=Erysipelothrix larvae TaxID=1514105 RepID=A0A0X8GZH8_9FIRM|nr:class I SAM-dependent methyltransferase [Erysipelothrix larvae]AMC93293.1 SAM-dependent methyltransferase [Erysipelothrix larvae]